MTTTANLWRSLALDKFSAKFESAPVAGRTVAEFGAGISANSGANSGAATGPGAQVIECAKPGGHSAECAAAGGIFAHPQHHRGDRQRPDQWSRGDVLRIRLEVHTQADMSRVVVSDPVPAGATILGSASASASGSGLGRG